MSRKRKDRGDWQRLQVKFRVSLATPRGQKKPPKQLQDLLKAQAILQWLETAELPHWAKIEFVDWINPDAEHQAQAIGDDEEAMELARTTLNRGGWLTSRYRAKVAAGKAKIRISTIKTKKKATKKRKKK